MGLVNKCCCCVSLRTGVITLGFITAIVSCFSFVSDSILLHKTLQNETASHKGLLEEGGPGVVGLSILQDILIVATCILLIVGAKKVRRFLSGAIDRKKTYETN